MTISNKKVVSGELHLVAINNCNMKVFLLIFTLFSLNGCKWFTNAGTPFFLGTGFKVPPGTPTFQKGFKDGCSSVLYSRGNVWYRTRYKYKYDPKMIGNPEYRFGHSRGYTWCFQQVIQGVSGPNASFDKAFLPYGYDSTHSAANIGNAWGGFFAGGESVLSASTTTPGSGFNSIFDVLQKGSSGSGATAFGTNPLWAAGSSGQFLGWD